MDIKELVWNDEREDHIASHGVHPEEVEDICYGIHLATRAGRSRYRLIGQTKAWRYLTVILDSVDGEVFQPVTARPAVEAERRRFRNWRN